MSIAYSVNIKDGATQATLDLVNRINPTRINTFVGDRCVRLTQNHLLKLPHNKMGANPVNFYADAARNTTRRITPDGVVIAINKIGMRQRLKGGRITAVNSKFLTIPIDPRAYGKTAADFGDALELVVIKGKGAYLALKGESVNNSLGKIKTGEKTKKGNARTKSVQGPERAPFMFILKRSVTQQPDPTVLPNDAEYLAEALKGASAAAKGTQ